LGGSNTYTNNDDIAKAAVRLGGNERLSDLMPLVITHRSNMTECTHGLLARFGGGGQGDAGRRFC